MDARFGTFASNSVRYEKTKSIHGDGLPARLLLRLFGPAGGCGAAAYRTHRYRGCLRYAADGAVSRLRQGGAGGQCGVQGRRDAPNDFRRRGGVRPARGAARGARCSRLPASSRSRRGRVQARQGRSGARNGALCRRSSYARRLRQGALRTATDHGQIRKQSEPARRYRDPYAFRRVCAETAVRPFDRRRGRNARADRRVGGGSRNRDQYPRLGVCPPQRIRRLRGGLRLLARQADSGCGASARRPTPTSSIRCGWAFRPICGRSRRRV